MGTWGATLSKNYPVSRQSCECCTGHAPHWTLVLRVARPTKRQPLFLCSAAPESPWKSRSSGDSLVALRCATSSTPAAKFTRLGFTQLPGPIAARVLVVECIVFVIFVRPRLFAPPFHVSANPTHTVCAPDVSAEPKRAGNAWSTRPRPSRRSTGDISSHEKPRRRAVPSAVLNVGSSEPRHSAPVVERAAAWKPR